NEVTPSPTASTSPANSLPRTLAFGRRTPLNNLMKRVWLRGMRSPSGSRSSRGPDEQLTVLGNGLVDLHHPNDVRWAVPGMNRRLHGSTAPTTGWSTCYVGGSRRQGGGDHLDVVEAHEAALGE